MERTQSLEENLGNASRLSLGKNKLLLVASVIQGLGLLLCLIFICLNYASQTVPPKNSPIQSIKVQFTECENEKGFILTSPNNQVTMKVQDNSIIINCDGFYLISLKGYFSQEVSLSLPYRKGLKPLLPLTKVKSIDAVTVAHLAFKDKVYLNVTTHNTSCKDIWVNGGELILIHQNPGDFCGQ
ncbi:PREDICTED: tumor necrosis factor ligand superfamily member 4-like [Chrysochloris asiatica]|uniref:Tumor necrosis factor ligand superfamily member 4 n=1 Tax=Chrysochloris asiatica TaxID=185453 RepID=A0A9B0TT32_CHRAS|nr:PREDICTED: tumor necrosis factor ligand superfamily member 4-like [Chrysochloris asiatica]